MENKKSILHSTEVCFLKKEAEKSDTEIVY